MKSHIILDQKNYFLVPESYQRSSQQPLFPRFSTGEPSLSDLSFWQYIAQKDWSGGAGQKDYEIPNKYWSSTGIIPSKSEFQKGNGGYPAWSPPSVVSCIHNGSEVLATNAALVALGLGTITAMVSWQGILWVAAGSTLYQIDHQKTKNNESFVADLNTWVDLDNKNIKSASVVEKGQYGNFIQGKDYIIDYREGRIMILPSGRMKESQNYTMKYTWANPTTVDPYILVGTGFEWFEDSYDGHTIKMMKWYQLPHARIIPQTFNVVAMSYDILSKASGYPSYELLADTGQIRFTFKIPVYQVAVVMSYIYENLADNSEVINEGYNTWYGLEKDLIQPGSELVIYDTTVEGNPDYNNIYVENVDYILDRTLGKIKCLSTGRMKQGETYYINYEYFDADEFVGASKVGVIPDGEIDKMIAYDKIYLIANSVASGYIYESDGKSLMKTVEQAGLTIEDLVLWKGIMCYSGGRTVLSEARGYLYQYPGKLLVEMKDGSGDQTICHLYPSEQLYYYLTNTGVYAWNELGYYLVSAEPAIMFSSELAGNTPLIEKLFNQITVEFKDSNHNLTLSVQKVEDGDSETLRLDKVDGNTYYADLPAQYIAEKVILRFGLGDSDTIVRRVIVRYVPAALLKKTWVFTIKAENHLKFGDGTYEARLGDEIENDLWALRDENKIIQFKDIDEREYSVIIQSLSHLSLGIDSGGKQEGEMTIGILET